MLRFSRVLGTQARREGAFEAHRIRHITKISEVHTIISSNLKTEIPEP